MGNRLRIVRGPDGLETTRTRELADVVSEARAREATAVRNGRLADAALYREIADRAEEVRGRERELGYARRTVQDDEAARLADDMMATARRERAYRVTWALVGIAILAAALALSGCAGPARGPSAGSLEVGAGFEVPTSSGDADLGDVGPCPALEVGGTFADGDALTGASGEWWARYATVDAMDVDAGPLGLFDLDADVVRLGVGLRGGTTRLVGLDWTLGLGAVLTVVDGTASAGTLSRDVSESGVGAYAALNASRGPLFLRVGYVLGPSVDVEGEDVDLGGASFTGGLRWTF